MYNQTYERKKHMKKQIPWIILTLCLILTTVASAATISPGLEVLAGEEAMIVSGIAGESVVFSQEKFSDTVYSDTFQSVTILSLPPAADGTLYFNDAAAAPNQVIAAGDMDKLRFEAAEGVQSTSFRFTFDRSYDMNCVIKMSDKNNNAPACTQGAAIKTFSNMTCAGNMIASDPDGDTISYEVVSYPENGTLSFNQNTGDFTYSPYEKVHGTDSFVYRVRDSYGAYSEECMVNIDVDRKNTSLSFSDMDDSSCQAAAIVMTNSGHMDFAEEDGEIYFEPSSEVTRLDFLVTAMNVLGAANIPEVTSTGFADDADIPAEYKGYVFSAHRLGIINGVPSGSELYFKPNEPITKAQASVILNNILGYSATAKINCSDEIPTWAAASIDALWELGIYPVSSGIADPTANLTKEDTAKMLFNMTTLLHE